MVDFHFGYLCICALLMLRRPIPRLQIISKDFFQTKIKNRLLYSYHQA
jgi:hypothetical protein